jgi:hypothetical protein
MSDTGRIESAAERALTLMMLAVFWTAFLGLGGGLAIWLAVPAAPAAATLLDAGLAGLLALPVLRLVAAIVSAARTRDWTTMAATLAVLVILFALTLRDASRH